MGLRLKVALMLVAAIIPISLVFSFWRIGVEHRAHLERRADRMVTRMERVPTRRCLRSPERFRVERREFVGYAYDPQFVSRNPNAPPVPTTVQRQLSQTTDPVHEWFRMSDDILGVTAVKLADRGPCAVVVVSWKSSSVPDFASRRALEQTIGLALLLAILGSLVTFPIVRRIRRLERAVHDARQGTFDPQLRGSDEINALADAFGETLQTVRQREEALEEYIANTTHDLAIPLTVLQHRLRKIASAGDNEDARVALEESHYIAGLIANMRAAAKLQNPNVIDMSHDVDLAEIVARVAQRHAPIATQKGVELNFAVPPDAVVTTGEPTLTEQALSNLVQNAVQYNASGGHVSIVLDISKDSFDLRVADDGPGIPEQMRDEVLKRGVRDDAARSRNEGGQGFGLAIVRRVCELHDWKLTLEHEEGLIVRIQGNL